MAAYVVYMLVKTADIANIQLHEVDKVLKSYQVLCMY